MQEKSIGIFDSGLGGLTVLNSIHNLLPHENLVYFGDTARVPYGSKSKDTIIQYSKEIFHFLIEQDIKMLVVACNTASSYVLDILQKNTKIPIIGVIEPGIQAALKLLEKESKKTLAVMATKSTIKSNSYLNILNKHNKNIILFQKACPLLVPLIEENFIHKKIMQDILREYIYEIHEEEISHVILGCTHYPLMQVVLNNLYPNINFIDSSLETAKFVKNILINMQMVNISNKKGGIKMYVSDITDSLQNLQSMFFSHQLLKIEKKILGW